jgi:hypothetical protein
MSGASQDVLLDSNAYFRLGNSIRPLLQQSFGSSPQCSLYVLAELDDEYATSVRLRHKFEWVIQAQCRSASCGSCSGNTSTWTALSKM